MPPIDASEPQPERTGDEPCQRDTKALQADSAPAEILSATTALSNPTALPLSSPDGSAVGTARTNAQKIIGLTDTWAGRYKELIELSESLERELMQAKQSNEYNHTCIHHTDAERAAITCPVCLQRELSLALAAKLAAEKELASIQAYLSDAYDGSLLEQIQAMHHEMKNERDEAEAKLLAAKKERDIAQSWIETLKRLDKSTSPCGHNAQFAYSPDGVGKVIKCAMCAVEKAAALRADCEALRGVLSGVQKDYSHAWPSEDAGTELYRLSTMDAINSALSSPSPGSDLIADRERIETLDSLMEDGDALIILVEDGGVMISKNGKMLHEPAPSLRSAIDSARQ